jgi:hypothetical protein
VAFATVVAFAACVEACGGARPAPAPKVDRGSPAAPRVVSGELDPRVLFGELPVRAQRLGAGAVSIVASSEMVDDERVGAFVEVPSDQCLLAYGRGASSVEDLDIAAFADEGNPVAVDEGPDPRPTLLLCPPHPDRVYLAAHVAAGEGLVSVGAQLVPRERATEVGRAVGARGGWGEGPRPAEGWPGLDDKVRARRSALGGTWEEVFRVAVTLDARAPSFVKLPLEAEGCVDFLVSPDETVAMLEVEVFDGDGRVVARAKEGGADRVATVCSPVAFTGSLSVRPHIGRGLAAVVVARGRGGVARDLSARPDVAWVAPAQPLEQTRERRNALLAKAGYSAPTMATSGALSIGRRAQVPFDLGVAPGCSRIDVVGGAPLALVEANVWDDTGMLVASGEGSDGATLFACGKGRARLELETRGRPGPYAVLVRKERWQDASFVKYPLAAARMLARSADGAAMMHAGAAASARSVVLDNAKLVTWEAAIPAGRCARVSVGTQGEGTGVGLRVFDAASGDEIDRSHAANAASVRACAAANATRTVRLELRTTSGRLDAVIGERLGG